MSASEHPRTFQNRRRSAYLFAAARLCLHALSVSQWPWLSVGALGVHGGGFQKKSPRQVTRVPKSTGYPLHNTGHFPT